MPIKMDADIAREIEEGMQTGGKVELPFAAPYAWVVNGDAKLRQVGGASYFGGWATKAEDLDAIVETRGVILPGGLTKTELGAGEDGFEAYTTRYLVVAPMGLRQSWIVNEMHQPEFVAGARRHLQVLALLAMKAEENGKTLYMPWGPVVLTAKGFQARNLLDAFTAWNRYSQSARKKFAPGVPAWCFYVAVGTFGDKPVSKMVGKGKQSPITPISAYLPKTVGEAELTTTFVGESVAQSMAEYRRDAHDWLSAWNAPVHDEANGDNGESGYVPEPEGQDPPAETGEDIPF